MFCFSIVEVDNWNDSDRKDACMIDGTMEIAGFTVSKATFDESTCSDDADDEIMDLKPTDVKPFEIPLLSGEMLPRSHESGWVTLPYYFSSLTDCA